MIEGLFSLVWIVFVMGFIMSIVKKAGANGGPQGQQRQQRQMPPQQYGQPQQQAQQYRQQQYRQPQQRNAARPDIVERAKANSKRYTSQDVTLQQMESEHGHSERVGSAVAGYVESEREAHRRMHEEPAPKVEEESCFGTVEDLMVKGYDGNLSFERDFIGEAQEFLASMTLSGQ